jgi:uncharacterized membrane protein YphA (DoxX/SURF4 family)
MNASQYAGTVIIPTLSRIVLCAAFFTAGWAKVFTNAPYSPEQVETLKQLGIDVRQAVTVHDAETSIVHASMPIVLTAQDEPVEPAQDEPTDPAQDEPVETPPVMPDLVEPDPPVVDDEAEVPPPVPVTTSTDGTYQALGLYKVAVTLHDAGWQYAYYLAWATAMLELIGGALLLIGLFSRVWGLGLAITMALAFHIMSMDAFIEAPFEIARKLDGGAMFHMVYAQLALFVLAFGIFITGPGPLSLDRAIFRRSAPDDVEIEVHERM